MRLPAPLVGVAVAGVLLVGVAAIVLHDRTKPYTSEQAVADFRSQHPTASTSAAADQVRPGVYTYATTGHEQVNVLGGSRHEYPTETTITYRRTACGGEGRWQPLQDRYSTNEVCATDAGGELRRAFQRHTFFGQADEQDLVCPPGLVLLPLQPHAGQVSTATCRGKDSTVTLRIEVLGLTQLEVGGRRTDVVHLVVTGDLAGAARGRTRTEEWLTPGGLTVRTVSSVASDRQTPVGTAHYTEQYSQDLRSLDSTS